MTETKFKDTEIGRIPEDWAVASLGSISDVKTGPFGSALHASDYVVDGTPIITVEHLGNMHIDRTKDIPRVDDNAYKRLSAYTLKAGDVVFSRVGSVDRCSCVFPEEHGWLFSSRLLRVRFKEQINSEYLTWHLSTNEAKRRILSVAVGLAMPSINTRILNDFRVIVPSNQEEQSRIASALSGIDNLISSLDNMIEKKKNIKQGTMQQLLTGKKRLKGFCEPWIEKRIDEVVTRFATGLNPRQNFVLNSGGQNYYVTIKNFREGKIYLNDECDKVDNEALRLINNRSDLRKGDLLLSSIGRVGDPCIVKDEPLNWNINESVFTLRPNKEIVSVDFLYYIFKSDDMQKKLNDSSTGSTLTSIKMGHLKELTITIAPTIKEQTAISLILNAMDDEISALEAKKAKYESIKQGMMQQLLTGKIRLL